MPSFEISGYRFSARITFRAEADPLRCCSVLRITRVEVKSEWGYVGSCWLSGQITVNGQTAAVLRLEDTRFCTLEITDTYSGGGENWSGFSAAEITAAHREDGTGSAVFGVTLGAMLTGGLQLPPGIGGSVTVELPRVPRATVLTAQTAELGQLLTIGLERAVESFRDTVEWKAGTYGGLLAEKTDAARLEFLLPESLAELEPRKDTVTVRLLCHTFDGETQVGSREMAVDCRIPESVKPTARVTLGDRMEYADRYGGYVQLRSQAAVHTDAAGAGGSAVESIRVSCGSLTASGADTAFQLPDSGEIPVTVTVTDSRGRQCTVTQRITVQPYAPPRAELLDCFRCDEEGNAQPDGGFARVEFSAAVTELNGSNTARYRVLFQPHGGGEQSRLELEQYRNRFTVDGGWAIFPAQVDGSFDCRIRAEDAMGSAESGLGLIPAAFALLDFNRSARAVGIGQRANRSGTVSIGLDMELTEHRLSGLAEPEEAADAATRGYVDAMLEKMAQALEIAELWAQVRRNDE